MSSYIKSLSLSGFSVALLCLGGDALAGRPLSESGKKPGASQPAAPSPNAAAAAKNAQGPAAPVGPAAAPKELSPAEAQAEVSGPKKEAARAHFERGVELYMNSDFGNAWLEFQSAYQIFPLVELLNNIARCEVRMGRLREALEHFQRFIAARPDDPDAEYIRQEIARIEDELGRAKAPVAAAPAAPPAAAPVRRIPAYSIMPGATTLALLIAGSVTLGLVNSNYSDLQMRCQPICNSEDVAALERQSYAGYGLLGIGAAGLAVTGLVLYWELRDNKESALRPLAGLRLGTPIGVMGRF